MKSVLNIYLLALTFLATPLALKADNNTHNKICNETRYLKCMGITTKKCISAYLKANKYCLKKYAKMPDGNDAERRAFATKYGKCSTERYISDLGTNISKLEKCAVYLEPILNAIYNDKLMKHKRLEKKFFEEDDPLHNH